MTPSRSSSLWTIPLLFIIALNGFALFRWTKADTRPLAWDQAIHTKIAFEYRDRLASGSLWEAMKPVDMNYPPLYHLSMVPFLSRVSDIADAGAAVNFFYLVMLLLAVYFIGEDMLGAAEGFAAAAMVGCYPAIADLARTTLIDLSLTAWVAVGYLCLIKARGFSNFLWSVAFGVALGCAMMTKWTALAYLLVPLCFSVWCGLTSQKKFNVFLSLLICAAIMWPWYIQNSLPMLARIPKLSKLPPASGENLHGIANVFWYPLSLFEGVTLPFLLLAVPGLFAAYWRPKLLPVFVWVVSSFVLFSLITNRNVRYIAPALPAIALLSAAWLPSGRTLPSLVIGVLSAAYLAVFNFLPSVQYSFPIGNQRMWVINGRAPAAENWFHEAITEKVRTLMRADRTPARVLVLSNTPFFHSTTMNITERGANKTDVAFSGPSKRRWFEFSDFVLLKTGDLGPEFTLGTIKQVVAAVEKPEPWFPHVYKEVVRWTLPDKSAAVLYQCKPDAVSDANTGLFNLSLNELELPNVKATGVDIRVTPLSKADTQVGRFKELTVHCKTLEYKNLPFRDVSVRLVEPQVNIPLYLETQEIQLLSLKALEPQATISADTLLNFAAEKAKWLNNPTLRFEGPLINVGGSAFGIPVLIQAEVKADGATLTTRLVRLSIGRVSVPLVLVRALTDQTVKLGRSDDWAYDLNVKQIQGNGSSLKVGI